MISSKITQYLIAIDELKQKHGYARQVDITKKRNISPSTCSEMTTRLLRKKLITEDENKFLSLTKNGEVLCQFAKYHQRMMFGFFHNALGVCCEKSEKISTEIEPLLDEEIGISLCRFMSFLESIKPGGKIDFWGTWENFTQDPFCNEKCLTCPHVKVCQKSFEETGRA